MSAWTSERARVASLTRSRQPDDPELVEARHRLRVARIADAVESVRTNAPEVFEELRRMVVAS